MGWTDGIWTDYPNPAGNGTFTDIIAYNNTISGDMFGIMMLISIFFVIFVAGSTKDSDTALASAAFVTTILSYIMTAMGAIHNNVAIAMTFLLLGAMVILLKKGGNISV